MADPRLEVGAAFAFMDQIGRLSSRKSRVRSIDLVMIGMSVATSLYAQGVGPATAPDRKTLPGAQPSEDLRSLAMLDLMLATCEMAIPDFKGRSTRAYAQWRKAYEPEITRFEQSPELAAQFRQVREQSAQAADSASADRSLVQQCQGVVLALSNPRDPERHPERYATPEKTWAFFSQSLRAADRKTALSCLTGDLLERISTAIEKMSNEMLRAMADTFVSLAPSHDMGRLRMYTLIKKDRTGYEVDFEWDGAAWRISNM